MISTAITVMNYQLGLRAGCIAVLATVVGCGSAATRREEPVQHADANGHDAVAEQVTDDDMRSFGDDVAFLSRHTDVIVLRAPDGGASVAVAPFYQGRVMTSSAGGDGGRSYGWINRPVIAAGTRTPHMTVVGGEERFWLGPEGSQYGLYFASGAPFDLAHWQVPEPLDWGGFEVRARDERSVTFGARMHVQNRAGTEFDIGVTRTIALVSSADVARDLSIELGPDVRVVAYESRNAIENVGARAWTREAGLVSIWILGMFNPSPRTTVVIPYVEDEGSDLGPVVSTNYFGEVPADRLVVRPGVALFRADGEHRSKIGIPKPRARSVLGSWDAAHGTLTLVTYSLSTWATDYVCSLWEEREAPYAGDVVNSYNDGPPEGGGATLGPFYELETSSAAAPLAPSQSLAHTQRTIHLEGARARLDKVARAVLGVGLDAIEGAFAPAG